MRVSKEEALQSRERIVEASSRLFRERGIDGIGVAELMKAAGFTHGGFYKHFDSKEALVAEACAKAFADMEKHRWSRLLEPGDDSVTPFKRFVESYLSKRHRDHSGNGCPLPALGPDVSRHGPRVRKTFTAGLMSLADLLGQALPNRREKARRERVLATLACLAGAISLSRAVDDDDLSREILQAAINWLE